MDNSYRNGGDQEQTQAKRNKNDGRATGPEPEI